MRRLLILLGKSGAGKDSVKNILCNKHGYHPIVNVTTRPKRKGEVDGVDYQYKTIEEYSLMVNYKELINQKCYITTHGSWYYGTKVDDLIDAPDKSVIILDPQGVNEVCDFLKSYEDIKPIVVYIYANLATITERLKKRGDSKEEIERRIESDARDFRGAENIENCRIFYNNKTDLDNLVELINEYVEERELLYASN